MGGQVEVARTARHVARLRFFRTEVQGLMAGVEIDAVGGASPHAQHMLGETQRFVDGFDHAVVLFGERRAGGPIQLEVLRVMEIGEAALDQRAHEVQGKRGALITAQQKRGVGRAGLAREFRPVDVVAAVGGQLHAIAHFRGGRARLGVLAREAAHADDRPLCAHHQHQAHLQQHFQTIGDAVGSAGREALGAIARLQHEAAAGRGLAEELAQLHDFPTGDQRRERA